MEKKVLLILCDGMRPDALEQLAHPFYTRFKAEGSSTVCGRTVMPSVTLPCHMSLFHSVDPDRHGVTTNIYTPQVRPIEGLCEQLHKFEKSSAFFYNWEELRDLSRPASLCHAAFYSGHAFGWEDACRLTVDDAKAFLTGPHAPDFAFLYIGLPDEVGHATGWMGEAYMKSLLDSWDWIEEVCGVLGEEYTVIVTADHGGHDRCHGTELPEDMTIPLLMRGEGIPAGGSLDGASIKDIAPTVAHLLGVPANKAWEGKALL